MGKAVVCWSLALLAGCLLAYADTPDWDPGTPIDGPVVYVDDQYVPTAAGVNIGEPVVFWAGGGDIDHHADPIEVDGVHCEWSYVPAGGGSTVNMGKMKSCSLCTCPGYEAESITYSWSQLGAYNVTCKMDDCHIWANDPDSKTAIIQVTVAEKPVITITNPPGAEIHLASGATIARLEGTATCGGSAVSEVQVGFTNTGDPDPKHVSMWYTAGYNGTTHVWTYDWQSPASKRIWVRATALAGNKGTIFRDVTVVPMSGDVIYVVEGGAGSKDGSTWGDGMEFVQDALDEAGSGDEVWVAEGTYEENITITAGVGLYGGFLGDEKYREERDFGAQQTVLEGASPQASVITVSDTSATASVNGFTITEGSGNLYDYTRSCGGGICCRSSAVRIENNRIMGNTAVSNTAAGVEGYGGGVYCEDCTALVIANNFITDNTVQDGWGGGVYLTECSGQVVGNTIAGNEAYSMMPPGPDCAVYYDQPLTLGNNIVASNTGGINNEGVGAHIIVNNCVYDNAEGNWGTLGTGCLLVDPAFVNLEGSDYHLSPDSLCRDAADDTYTEGLFDIDTEPRIQDFASDIGADEISGCGRVDVSYPEYGTPGQAVTITAHAVDSNGQPTPGVTICFSVIGGTLTEINGSPPPESGCGDTDTSGDVTAKVMRDTPGTVEVTLSRTCGSEQPTRTIDIPFAYYWHVGFLYDLCTDTYENPKACTDAFLQLVDSRDDYITYEAISGTSFDADDLAAFNTIFVVMPVDDLDQDQLTALHTFVDSRRDKRIVLIGEYNPDYFQFNYRLNTIAADLGIASQFSLGGSPYDQGGPLCAVNSAHYLMQDVDGLRDSYAGAFTNIGSHAVQLSWVCDSPNPPWILAEYGGSRILIHDSTMMHPNFGYPYMTDKNFQFIYNLCTIFE